MTAAFSKSNCPISPDFAECKAPCEWYVKPCEHSDGGCVVILILAELWALRPRVLAASRRTRARPGDRTGPPAQPGK